MKTTIASLIITIFVVASVAIFVSDKVNLPSDRLSALTPLPGAIPPSFFGMTMHHYPATPWPSIPFASLRTWDTTVTWPDIQKTPDVYNWSTLDAMLELAQSRNVELLFTLGRTPRWASASPDAKSPFGPGQCAPPAKMQYWDDFIRAIVGHAGGKIKFWETWNEPQSPDSVFYCGDIETMVELQRRANEIIKSIDPGAKVLTPSAVGGYGPPWMARFLAAGGGRYADVMAFHGYLAPSAQPESLVPAIADFKSVFAKHGQGTKPVWDTEAGWGQDQWLPDPSLQAAFLAKFYLLHWSSGVERFYWYAYDNEIWGTLWDKTLGLHEAGVAYREVHRWLEGATMTSPCSATQSLWKCGLSRENGYRAEVVWRAAGAPTSPSSISVPNEFRQFRDLEGHLHAIAGNTIPISIKPIIVETGSAF